MEMLQNICLIGVIFMYAHGHHPNLQSLFSMFVIWSKDGFINTKDNGKMF